MSNRVTITIILIIIFLFVFKKLGSVYFLQNDIKRGKIRKNKYSAIDKRGIRNNNPGNIRIGSSKWKGKILKEKNSDGSFEQFVSYEYGVRALIILLKSYVKQGHNTINKIITRYAPSHENNTELYINSVVDGTGIGSDEVINGISKELAFSLVVSIIKMENGGEYITKSIFNRSWSLI